MGNHRFRLSDIMPNAWFYKLKDMSRGSRSSTLSQAAAKKAHAARTGGSSTPKKLPPPQSQAAAKQPCYQPGRASYYFPSGQQEKPPGSPVHHPRASDTLFPAEPPRKSQKKVRRKPQARPRSAKLVSSSVSSGCSCRATIGSVWKTEAMPEFPPAPASPPYHDDYEGLPFSDKPIIAEHYDPDSAAAWPGPCTCRFSASATDIILDVATKGSSAHKNPEAEDLHAVPELGLPPILTKPAMEPDDEMPNHPCPPLKEHKSSLRRSSPAGAQGLRMRTSSPRLASKKLQAHRHRKAAASTTPRKFLSESCAVVKSSADPQRDFRDSMVEMIVENNIRTSRELEELLACYLSLNSNEYHDVIVKVFEQIWFDLTNIRL